MVGTRKHHVAVTALSPPAWLVDLFAAQVNPDRSKTLPLLLVKPSAQQLANARRSASESETDLYADTHHVAPPWRTEHLAPCRVRWTCASCDEPVPVGRGRCDECGAAIAAAIERIRPTPRPPTQTRSDTQAAPLSVWTATLRVTRDDPDGLDVSRGTGFGSALSFAPSRALLQWSRENKRSDAFSAERFAEYTRMYLAEMRESYRTRRSTWEALLAQERVVLGCHCVTPQQCHRKLLAKILVKLGASYQGELSAAHHP